MEQPPDISWLYRCDLCSFSSLNRKDFNRHKTTKKHLKREYILSTGKNIGSNVNPEQDGESIYMTLSSHTDDTEFPELGDYGCHLCKYHSDKKSNYIRHINSRKHILTYMISHESLDEICVCGFLFETPHLSEIHKAGCIHRLRYLKHKELYKRLNKTSSCDAYYGGYVENNDFTGSVLDEMSEINEIDEIRRENEHIKKENQKLVDVVVRQQDKINDIIPKIGNTTNNNVNINVFLNEKCKDAINLMDFVNSIQLQLKDLERSAEIGYVDSISTLFIEGLNQMNVTDRPIHCTDTKRDVLYVRDNDVWEKETATNERMKRAIKKINKTNSRQIPEWVTQNPSVSEFDSAENSKYMEILSNTVACEDEEKKLKKIIKNVAKAMVLDKDDCV